MSDGLGSRCCWDWTGSGSLEMLEGPRELVVTTETTAVIAGCGSCGSRAMTH